MIRQSTPRISKVTPKKGGADIHLIPDMETDVRHTLLDDARHLSSMTTDRMAGYAIVTWDRNAHSFASCRTHQSPVPHDITPEFVSRTLRNIIT